MRLLGFHIRNTSTEVSESLFDSLTEFLDRVRIALLRMTMRVPGIKPIYADRSVRLGVSFVFFSIIYLLMSLKWSMMLLVIGPMILGYPHLVASYRFLQGSLTGMRWNTQTVFQIFAVLTLASLGLRFVAPEFIAMPKWPYATWEIGLSALAIGLIALKMESINDVLISVLAIAMITGVLKLAWHDPLAFVGIALMAHNWVAFGHWFISAKDRRNRVTAILATCLFAFVHALVFLGHLDSWMAISEFKFLSTQSFEVRGWALAPWSSSPVVWDRMIVLYTFGLSMHYFVWLQAIPQCLDQNTKPNSFRRSLEQLRRDCGGRTTIILAFGALALLALWFFTSIAGRFYFGLALLHGWLELAFLIVAVSTAIVNFLRLPKNIFNK